MGLFSTLTKVALGVAIAKGYDHVSRNGLPKLGDGGIGGMLGKIGTTPRANPDARAPHSNALEDMLHKPAGAGLNPIFNQAIVGHEIPEPTRQTELAAALMLRAMVQAAMADGKLDDAESAKLMEHMADATEEELAFVTGLMDQPVDIASLVADVPDGMEAQVYLISVMAIDLDSRAEAQYLHDLASALGLDQASVNSIHRDAGLPLLYA